MATVTDPVGTGPDLERETADSSRIIRPRRAWPGSRATVGGLLVAIAAVGLFSAFQSASSEPETRYVVARADIGPGTVLAAEHLATQPMELPDSLSSRVFALGEEGELLGAVTTQAIGAGELVQISDVRAGNGAATVAAFEASFSVDAARAVDGTIRAGETIDIIATLGTGQTAPTQLVVRSILVLDVNRSDESGFAARRQVITVALEDRDHALSIAAAADKGQLTLVRSNQLAAPD